MKFIFSFLILAGIALLSEAYDLCPKLQKAWNNRMQQKQNLQNLYKAAAGATPAKPPANEHPCHAELRKIDEDLATKYDQHEKEWKDCLDSRINDAMDVKNHVCNKTAERPDISSVTFDLPTANNSKVETTERRKVEMECEKKLREIVEETDHHLHECCSESRLCDLRYSNSTLQNEIANLELQQWEKQRECEKIAMTATTVAHH
jgi:hypothetical protein